MEKSISALAVMIAQMTVGELCTMLGWTPRQLLQTCERLREKAEPPPRRRKRKTPKRSAERRTHARTKRQSLGVTSRVGLDAEKGLVGIRTSTDRVAEDEAGALASASLAVRNVEPVGHSAQPPALEEVAGVERPVGEAFEVDGFHGHWDRREHGDRNSFEEGVLRDESNGSRLSAANDIIPVSRVRKRTLSVDRITKTDLKVGALLFPERVRRPTRRSECRDGVRPCPYVSCRWNLFLDVTEAGNIVFNHPDKEPWQLAESCALDVAERGGETLEEVGACVNLTRERVRQVIEIALAHLRERGALDGPLADIRPDSPVPIDRSVEHAFGA